MGNVDSELRKLTRRILKDIRVELGDEFDQNFERQGFFSQKWQRRRSPVRGDGHILVASGQLRQSIKSRSDDVSITFYSDLPYAAIHNAGGEIRVTARMKRFFWHKHRESSGEVAEFWKHMALMKEGKTIKIPRRQFLGMAPEVEREVRQIIEQNLSDYFEHYQFK